MNTETVEKSNAWPDEQAQRVAEAEKAIHEYQQSRAFAEDLLNAFTEASRQAREENERLGLSAPAEPLSVESLHDYTLDDYPQGEQSELVSPSAPVENPST